MHPAGQPLETGFPVGQGDNLPVQDGPGFLHLPVQGGQFRVLGGDLPQVPALQTGAAVEKGQGPQAVPFKLKEIGGGIKGFGGHGQHGADFLRELHPVFFFRFPRAGAPVATPASLPAPVACKLAFKASIRSTTFAVSGVAGTATSSPAILAWINSIRAARYSLVYFSGWKGADKFSIRLLAMVISLGWREGSLICPLKASAGRTSSG